MESTRKDERTARFFRKKKFKKTKSATENKKERKKNERYESVPTIYTQVTLRTMDSRA